MGLRIKILSGFLTLAVMLFIAGSWTLYELNIMGNSVEQVIEKDYKVLWFAKNMKNALEREDSAILIKLLGEETKGEKIMREADSLFQSSLVNLSDYKSDKDIDKIKSQYYNFLEVCKFDKPNDISASRWYTEKIQNKFYILNQTLDKLINSSDTEIYNTALNIKARSERAIMPGIVAMIAAVLFSIIFYYMVNFYLIKPIIGMTKKIKDSIATRKQFDFHVESHDEMSKLSGAIAVIYSYINFDEHKK